MNLITAAPSLDAITPGETIRLSVPRMVPDEFMIVMRKPLVDLPKNPFPLHDDGIPLQEVLDYVEDPAYIKSLGVDYDRPIMVAMQEVWLHISWPGYQKYTHTVPLKHDGTVGSVVVSVARAYRDFLREARNWEFESDELNFWRITGHLFEPHHLWHMRLRRLCWINGDIYQAEIELVV
ncbi:hypothetical protein C8T65DRAFT_741749 [Cerioporus squamosus]|nr:hypothetical protein C8T65DRAFT_741749 [Cerioporus squamosus]